MWDSRTSMAKLRQNHQRASNPGTLIARGGIFAIIIGVLYAIFSVLDVEVFEPTASDPTSTSTNSGNSTSSGATKMSFLPSSNGQVVHHQYYSMSYREEFEQPEWVAYRLTKDIMSGPHVKRDDNFRSDPLVKTKSATKYDYKRSGYDRGHLVPAGDMNFNKTAMSETFFMSNMSPQIHNFNGGVWRELEEQTRDWVRQYKTMNIISGPVLTEKPIDYIGDNDVAVPAGYYKVLMTEGKTPRAIGFLMDHETSDEPLQSFMVTIDEVEAATGLDFFKGMLDPKEEERLESYIDKKAWRVNEKRYQTRREKWNYN